MKRIYLFLWVLVVCFEMSAQVLNADSSSYTEVVDVELSKNEIHQKLAEWVALKYTSSNDVVQLNTESKIIVKGNYILLLENSISSFELRVHNTLSFSIKDNKYKIDLSITNFSSDLVEYDENLTSFTIKQYLSAKPMTKENYSMAISDFSMQYFLKMGFSERKAEKMLKETLKNIDKTYQDYLTNYGVWNERINNLFVDVKTYVVAKQEDW